MGDAFLRSDERDDLGGGIEVDLEPARVPGGYGLAQFVQAVVLGIAVIDRIVRGPFQSLDDWFGRWKVRVADAEADDVHALGPLRVTQLVEFREEVGRKVRNSVGEFDRGLAGHFRGPPRSLCSAMRLRKPWPPVHAESVRGPDRPKRPAAYRPACPVQPSLGRCGPQSPPRPRMRTPPYRRPG